ncbi:MAG TPA: pantoate--beta-alanine ligase [Microscillaceae bacterium]|jgi:pantoate--beta-alanine ligase|nr:pantoate--beta-alanine ligase [Microscillaceae bacterium]
MQVFQEINPLKAFLHQKKREGKRVGFVPTMGALHQGHISLINASTEHNDITVCSIYVNPTQFNNPADLKKYPRTLAADKAMLQDAGCQVLFLPDNAVMYPVETKLQLNFGRLEKTMEGKHRPGHFNGVGLVVSKLLHIVEPDVAYFGQKDLQQYLIIRQMVQELFFPTALVCCPIVREPDGLAMSSRNVRLSKAARKKATILYQCLSEAKTLFIEGRASVAQIKKYVGQKLTNQTDLMLEYFEIVDAHNLLPITKTYKTDQVAFCIAAEVGGIRLIDNLFLNEAIHI